MRQAVMTSWAAQQMMSAMEMGVVQDSQKNAELIHPALNLMETASAKPITSPSLTVTHRLVRAPVIRLPARPNI